MEIRDILAKLNALNHRARILGNALNAVKPSWKFLFSYSVTNLMDEEVMADLPGKANHDFFSGAYIMSPLDSSFIWYEEIIYMISVEITTCITVYISVWVGVVPLLVLLCGSPCWDVFFHEDREEIQYYTFFSVGMQAFRILRLYQE